MADERSEPGQGADVRIFVLDPIQGQDDTEIFASIGEDFSRSGCPIVVKVKPEVSAADLVRSLLDLAHAVEARNFGMDLISPAEMERRWKGREKGT